MTVEPDADGAVTIALPAGRGCAVSGAICTKGETRRPLTNSPSATVAGPVGVAVADCARGGGGGRPAGLRGDAEPGGERDADGGLPDGAHDEGEETLTLTLSNASSGRVTDGEATGTIENHDPLPRALLARFGRTAAVHVVEHVEERLAVPLGTPGLMPAGTAQKGLTSNERFARAIMSRAEPRQ